MLADMENANNTTLDIQPCSCTAQGVTYLCLGIFGILENIVTAILIGTDPELRNPTYYYMINLCLADAVELCSIGIYQGLVLLDANVARTSLSNQGVSMWLEQVGMFETTIFLILISANQWLSLRSVNVTEIQFSKAWLYFRIVGAWLIFPAIYAILIAFDLIPLVFDMSTYNWTYDLTQSLGRVLGYGAVGYAAICILIVCLLNARSLCHVRTVRKKAKEFVSNRNVKVEIKLFAQCALTAMITMAVIVAYSIVIAFRNRLHPSVSVMAHIGWMLTHIHSPIIYFFMNSRLRQRALDVMRCKCRQQQNGTVDKVHSLRNSS